jgi:hypothetical protein
MAKAKDKHTPAAKPTATADQLQRDIKSELAKASDNPTIAELRKIGDNPTIAELRKIVAGTRARLAGADAKSAELNKARKTIDRALAIKSGLMAPPWASELLSLLKSRPTTTTPTGAGVWIKAEAARLKAAGKISDGMRITHMAKLLEKRLKAAAVADRSLRPVSWRHIKNCLPDWGLWPVSSIK